MTASLLFMRAGVWAFTASEGRDARAWLAARTGFYDGCLCDDCFLHEIGTWLDHEYRVDSYRDAQISLRAAAIGAVLFIPGAWLHLRSPRYPTAADLAMTRNCPNCGYPRTGLEPSAPCPECGVPPPSRQT